MKTTAYYAIIPTDGLAAKFITLADDVREALLEPSLWSHEQPGHSIFTRDDYLSSAKKLFIRYVESICLPRGSLSLLFVTAPDAPPEQLFDIGWMMCYFDGVDSDMSEIVSDVVATAEDDGDVDIPEPFRLLVRRK
jgi:hypothetical protein